MQHLALYRKYRPITFEEVIGQDHITKTLKNQVENKQISHAYLLYGTRGVGKTSIAKIFAKAINCLNPKDGSPCLKCSVCKSLEDVSNLDILEIDAASNNRVDEIRDLREKIKYTPINGKYKVYIIDEVHMLTDSAFNALLKTLEEPPSHAVFILATTEVHKLPATILSRVMRFDFKLVGLQDLINLLTNIFAKQNIIADAQSLKAIALAGEGSVRDTLSIADVCASYSDNNITYQKVLKALGLTTKEVLLNLAQAIINKDASTLLNQVNQLVNEGKNISLVAKDITLHFRDLMVIKSIKDANNLLNLPQDLYNAMSRQAQQESSQNLLFYMQTLASVEGELKYSSNERLLLEAALLLCINQNANTLQDLQKRLETLEKQLVTGTKTVNLSKSGKADLVKEPPQPSKTGIAINTSKDKDPLEQDSVLISSKKDNKKEEKINPLSLKTFTLQEVDKIWGKLLLSLSEEDYPVLYTAIADATPLGIKMETLGLQVDTLALQTLIQKQENINILKQMLAKQGHYLNIQVVAKKASPEDKKEEILKEKFGDLLKIID